MKKEMKKGTAMAINRPERPMLPSLWNNDPDWFSFRPLNMMRRLNEMEKMFDNFNFMPRFPLLETELAFPRMTEFENVMWTPEIEIKHKKGHLMVRADLPGMKKEDINIEVDENGLVLSGERKMEMEEEEEGFYRSERTYGSFYRMIPLPEGAKVDTATAAFNNGVLEIDIAVPKAEKTTRKLPITEKALKAQAKTA